MMVSLDGFFEGLDHDLSWHNVDQEFNEYAIEQTKSVDIILFGRRTYEMMANFWPTDQAKDDPIVAGLMNNSKKIVFSKTLMKADWQNTILIKNNTAEEIIKLKKQEGKNIAIYGSNNLTVSLIEKGLVDEFRIMINPVVIGKGTLLFQGLQSKLDLTLMQTKNFKNGNVLLYYKP